MAKTHEDVNFEVHYGGEMRRFEFKVNSVGRVA